jgi:hypothetical protein
VFPSEKAVQREREKLRDMTNRHQCHKPIPVLIGERLLFSGESIREPWPGTGCILKMLVGLTEDWQVVAPKDVDLLRSRGTFSSTVLHRQRLLISGGPAFRGSSRA